MYLSACLFHFPKIDMSNWLATKPHQVNICDRWNQNKAGLASTALFNGKVLFFRPILHSMMPLVPTMLASNEQACGQCHFSWVSTPLTDWHCNFRPNAEGIGMESWENVWGTWNGMHGFRALFLQRLLSVGTL
jgi:hypothetical protein